MLPYTDLLINQQTDTKWPITPSFQPVLALGYGLGPNEPRVFRTDDAGNLQVALAAGAVPSFVAIQDYGTTFRAPVTTPFDGFGSTPGLLVFNEAMVFNGATWNLTRAASAANLAAQSGLGATLVAPPGQWSVQHSPAVGAKATISQAAGAAGVRNVCTGFGFGLSAGVAVAATVVQVNLRDGATGAGTILKSWIFSLAAAIIPPIAIEVTGCEIPGSAATAMTIEFTALLANLQEYVNLSGHLAS